MSNVNNQMSAFYIVNIEIYRYALPPGIGNLFFSKDHTVIRNSAYWIILTTDQLKPEGFNDIDPRRGITGVEGTGGTSTRFYVVILAFGVIRLPQFLHLQFYWRSPSISTCGRFFRSPDHCCFATLREFPGSMRDSQWSSRGQMFIANGFWISDTGVQKVFF